MRVNKLIYCATVIVLYATPCTAYRGTTHRSSNGTVITQKLLSSQQHKYFIESNLGYRANDMVNGIAISDWFENAGAQEDQPLWRTPNHFLDLITNISIAVNE